jgi:hypothetical protein
LILRDVVGSNDVQQAAADDGAEDPRAQKNKWPQEPERLEVTEEGAKVNASRRRNVTSNNNVRLRERKRKEGEEERESKCSLRALTKRRGWEE